MVLSDERQIIRVWDAFAEADFKYVTASGESRSLDSSREQRNERLPIRQKLLQDFLSEEIGVTELKNKMASEVGSHKLWGFSGFSGQMFFNMLVSTAETDGGTDLSELLRDVLAAPAGREEVAEQIKQLGEYVEQLKIRAEDRNSVPSPGYIPYFVSYFWQLQNPNTYPIYYTSIRRAMSDLAIWEPSGDLAEDYLEFWELNEEIRDTIENHTGEEIHLWTIERMCLFWLNRTELSEEATITQDGSTNSEPTPQAESHSLPDSYIPPIVSVLPDLARNTEDIQSIAEEMGQAVETLFEDRLAKCLRMLGYAVDERGQGTGQNPDGIAKARQYNYALIYDAKVRQNGYRFSTNDERQFRDYIDAEVQYLQNQGFRNIYFVVFSGTFDADRPDAIRRLKIATQIQEVRLIEAAALLELLETRLRDPSFSLGPTGANGPGMQDLFAESGVLTSAEIQEQHGP
ncbi:hypothetical protein BG842_02900 [Haladaptatus sp. W1]|uniref:hypothetical protein n=1 Tax=Haladaptatus sp. W1 TaxID=1897478 RepID=UPI000849B565|nr:hypothetical protein [Haladaptatus sp. W1]ODR80030.1 hypothetical protein BG842_02900 [Haladaptatus sp. W1]